MLTMRTITMLATVSEIGDLDTSLPATSARRSCRESNCRFETRLICRCSTDDRNRRLGHPHLSNRISFPFPTNSCFAVKTNSRVFIVLVTVWSTAGLVVGCGQPAAPSAGSTPISPSNTYPTSSSLSLTFVVPEHVKNILKRKCYICHGGTEVKGGFDFRKMVYQSEPESNWRPMDLAGVTRIKLAILPLDGKPARMPKRAGSIRNPLTLEEANAVAKWTDYPYER